MSLTRLFARRVACSLVLALAGCADGYPSNDEPLALVFGMDLGQVEQAMNQIGAHRYLEHRWQYRLDKRCGLQVKSKGLDRYSVELSAPHAGWSTTMQPEGETGLHSVSVHPEAGSELSAMTVIAGANWSDASQIKWLIDYLPMLCTE